MKVIMSIKGCLLIYPTITLGSLGTTTCNRRNNVLKLRVEKKRKKRQLVTSKLQEI